jgi:hypothetical protein
VALGVDITYIFYTCYSSQQLQPNGLLLFPQLLLHNPQLAADFSKVIAQLNTP